MKDKILEYIKKNKFALILTLIYGVFIIIFSFFHEVWRDEVRALNYATEARSLLDLFHNLKVGNEGHPALWHVLLYIGYNIFHTTVILKVLNIIISIAAIYIFLAFSPFTKFQKTLFVFGFFPFYQFSIVNRSYSLIMLLLFLMCLLYQKRIQHILLFSFILALLANTHSISIFITYAFFISLVTEYILSFSKTYRNKYQFKHPITIVSFFIVMLGILFSFYVGFPDQNVTYTQYYNLDFDTILQLLKKVFLLPALYLYRIMGLSQTYFLAILFFIYCIYLFLLKPVQFIIFYLGMVVIEIFFNAAYYPRTWHLGIVYIFIISIFWVDLLITPESWLSSKPLFKITNFFKNKFIIYKNFYITILLIIQVSYALPAIYNDLNNDFSSSEILANDIKNDIIMKNAIIVSEPDEYAESLMYYIDNKIYIPREGRFGKTVRWSLKYTKTFFSLDELLQAVSSVSAQFKKPVVIITTYRDLGINGPFVKDITQGRIFTYDEASLMRFLEQTVLFKNYKDASGFDDVSGMHLENYDVYIYPKDYAERFKQGN